MKRRFAKSAAFAVAGLLVGACASAQFVPLSRCRGAIPCSIPFAVTYRPDPLIAGPYANSASHVPLVVAMPLELPLKPHLDPSAQKPLGAALDDAIHRSLQTHRPAGSEKAKPPSGQGPGQDEGNPPKPQPPPQR